MEFEIQNKGDHAVLKLTGTIGWWETSGQEFTRQIDDLIKKGITDVFMYINSPGGSMFDANEIGNQITRFTGNKKCKLGAIVASAATIVSTYFDQVVASSNTQYMIHDPSVLVNIKHLDDFESNKSMYENLRNDAINRYNQKTNLPKSEIDKMMAKTTWMNAAQAKDKHFVDEVIKNKSKVNNQDIDNLIQMGIDLPESLKNQNKPINMDTENKDLLNEIEQLKNELNTEKETKANLLVSMAKEKGLPTEGLLALAKNDFENALKFVSNLSKKASDDQSKTQEPEPKPNISAHNDALDLLVNALKGGSKSEDSKKWDDLSPEEREQLHIKDEAAYEKMFNEKHLN